MWLKTRVIAPSHSIEQICRHTLPTVSPWYLDVVINVDGKVRGIKITRKNLYRRNQGKNFSHPKQEERHFSLVEQDGGRVPSFSKPSVKEKWCEKRDERERKKDGTEEKDTRKSLEAVVFRCSSSCAIKFLRYLSADVARKYLPCCSVSRARVFIQAEGWNAKLKRHSSADPRQSNPFSSLHSEQSIVSSYCRTRVRRL